MRLPTLTVSLQVSFDGADIRWGSRLSYARPGGEENTIRTRTAQPTVANEIYFDEFAPGFYDVYITQADTNPSEDWPSLIRKDDYIEIGRRGLFRVFITPFLVVDSVNSLHVWGFSMVLREGADSVIPGLEAGDFVTIGVPQRVDVPQDLPTAARQLISSTNTVGGLEWVDNPFPADLGDAGQVLRVNSGETAPEWGDAIGAIYRIGLGFSSTTGDGSWANRVIGTTATGTGSSINRGGFTTVTGVGGGVIGSAIVIPSDGVYQITYTLLGNVNSDSSGGTSRTILKGRIRRVRGSVELGLGIDQVGYARGQYGSQFSEASVTVTTVFGMEADDRVFIDTEITQQDNTRTMTLDGEVSIVKL